MSNHIGFLDDTYPPLFLNTYSYWIQLYPHVPQGQTCACALTHTKAVISTGVINGRAERNAAGASGSYRLIQTLA